MWQLIRRDFIVNWGIIALACSFPLITNLLKLPNIPMSTYTILFMLLFAYTFYYERINHVNRTIISLPIKRNHSVLGRYISLFMICSFYLLYIWLLDSMFFHSIILNGYLVLFIFTVLSITIAVSIPIYYFFQSIWVSIFVQFTVLFVGSLSFIFMMINPFIHFDPFISFVLDIIFIAPITVSMIISFLFLYVSYLLSCWIFAKKDLV